MARVTVEDCVQRVPNRFELVLLAAHRARAVATGSPITVERENDKNPVVALRELADATVSSDDLREDLIHSIQKYVEIDEPEADAAPIMEPNARIPNFGRDSRVTDATVDRMSEEELLRGLESQLPIESSASGNARGR